MFNSFQPYNKSAEQAMKALFALIIINVVCFLGTRAPNFTLGGNYFQDALQGIQPKDYLLFTLNSFGVKHFWLWQYVTSMFMHANFSHIFFNMYGLWLFGKLVAPVLGLKRFLILYFISGLLGGLIYTVSAINEPYFMLLGASGAVMGITVACGMLLPNTQFVLLFFPSPVKAKTLVIIYVGMNFLFKVAPVGDSNIAYLAHLGGALGAYVYLKIIYRKNSYMIWDPFAGLFGKKGFKKNLSKDYKAENVNQKQFNQTKKADKYSRFQFKNTNISVDANDGYKRNKNEKFSQSEIDYLLNKISEQGVKSLTEEEFQKLKEIRKQVQKNR